MDIFDALEMIGGLCLFLFGMNIMGQALERRAGSRLRTTLGKMTGKTMTGFLTGLVVTAVIQSSSATTVMVVGFVNSGLMTLKQAIGVIMGANIGTTVTAWLLSLGGISGDAVWVQLLKPTSFTPVLALIGIIMYMFSKDSRKNDTGMIMLGFATLMFGMDTMSGAVSGLREVPAFRQLFVAFTNPLLGVLAGAALTAIIQSSSASVGILQALALSGQVSYAAAIPIIMGQNIGTCVTALISSVGTSRNAKRAAIVHLSFNVIGTVVWLAVFCIVRAVAAPAILGESATMYGIAIAHTAFNVACTALLLPASGLLEKLAIRLVPDGKKKDAEVTLDERLLATPPLALEQCSVVAEDMAYYASGALKKAIDCVMEFDPKAAQEVRESEDKTDTYEDMLGTYLLKLGAEPLSDAASEEVTELLKLIGDFERIGDHAVNIIESAEEMHDKQLEFSRSAKYELSVMSAAVGEVMDLAVKAFAENDAQAASCVEPLEQVVDDLKDELRTRHILRMKKGECSIEAGFVWSDLLTNLERASDHCSNVALCVLDLKKHTLSAHETQHERKDVPEFSEHYRRYSEKYALPL
ncbi:MAG: Na/Pi cotransporter family protein [Oscillospiraceae bacterium]|nr:Na/Pi cotransporter family protein [Oscillospiraceae bacterium]